MRAVIFDLDGLMINSEPLSLRAWQELLAPFGKALTEDDYRRLLGTNSQTSTRYVLERTQVPLTLAELRQSHWDRLLALIEVDLEPQPGLLTLVHDLERRDIPCAVASNSPTVYVERALHAIGLPEAFRGMIGADQVKHGKPAPDVYLAAAACLGISPWQCLALEDTSVGVEAAVAAGMRCVAVPNPSLASADFTAAYACVPSLSDVRSALPALLDGRY